MSQTDMFRCIPTDRLAVILTNYISANYSEERPVDDFCHDAGFDPRFLRRIMSDETPNISFGVVDRIFVNLGCQYIWHLSPEEGGLADYYHPDIPPAPREPSVQQKRAVLTENIKRAARKKGIPVIDEAYERALLEDNRREGVAA